MIREDVWTSLLKNPAYQKNETQILLSRFFWAPIWLVISTPQLFTDYKKAKGIHLSLFWKCCLAKGNPFINWYLGSLCQMKDLHGWFLDGEATLGSKLDDGWPASWAPQEMVSWTNLDMDQLGYLAEKEILNKTRSGPIGLSDKLYIL